MPLTRWCDGLRAMGAHPNIVLKLSNFTAYVQENTSAADRDVVRKCVDAFGPGRCLFGSDYPVGRRHTAFRDIVGRFRAAIEEYTPAEQRALFHDNAAALYAIEVG